MGFLLFLLIGLVAGWIAGQIMKGQGYGLVGNLIVGVIGAFIGGVVFGLLGIGGGNLIGELVAAVVCRLTSAISASTLSILVVSFSNDSIPVFTARNLMSSDATARSSW